MHNYYQYSPAQALKVLSHLAPSYKLTFCKLNHIRKFADINPSGDFLGKAGRQLFTFADIVAFGFLIDMKEAGIPMKLTKQIAKTIQRRRNFPMEFTTSITTARRITTTHETGKLAARIESCLGGVCVHELQPA